ncbi:MAG: J domain-containing protein [Pseudomonadota bacterium]
MAKDLYVTLGVSRGASPEEIKRAYRKLAKKYHPDATGGEAASSERFKEVSAAFEVLGDADRRALYNEFGDDALRPNFDAEKARAYQKWARSAGSRRGAGAWQSGEGGDGFGGFQSAPGTGGFNVEDLFGDLFRGRGGPMQRSRNLARTLEVDLETAMRGGTMRLAIDDEVECTQCDGRGQVGLSNRSVCMACNGRGRSPRSQSVSVNIPPRVPDGSKLTLKGKGQSGGRGAAGDLVLEIKIAAHPVFRREGKDLLVDLPITVDEAVLGSKVSMLTPDGRTLALSIKPGSQSGQQLRLKGQGLGTGKRAGNLIAILSIRVPRQGGEQAATDLREAYSDEVTGAPRG